jgi:FkbM family methyltransferase
MNILNGNSINFWEIGASGKIKEFYNYNNIVEYVGFEPNKKLALLKKSILENSRNFKTVKIHEFGLGNYSKNEIFICKHVACSSLLIPNSNYINLYQGIRYKSKNRMSYAEHFEVIKKEEIKCFPIEELVKMGIKVNPDYIQIDIQGMEYEVLSNFPNIEDVLMIDVELSVDEHYLGQVKFDKISNYLLDKGFQLIDIKGLSYASRKDILKNNYIDKGELVQFDGVFIKKILPDDPNYKLKLIKLAILLEINLYYSSSIYYFEEAIKADNENIYRNEINNNLKNIKNKIKKENAIIRNINILKLIINYFLRKLKSNYQIDFVK